MTVLRSQKTTHLSHRWSFWTFPWTLSIFRGRQRNLESETSNYQSAYIKNEDWKTHTTSAINLSSEGGLSRHCPVQYRDTGEPQRSMGDRVLPYHDAFSMLVEIESDLLGLLAIGVIGGKSKAPADGLTGEASTWSIDVRFQVTTLRDKRLACVTERRGMSIPKRR